MLSIYTASSFLSSGCRIVVSGRSNSSRVRGYFHWINCEWCFSFNTLFHLIPSDLAILGPSSRYAHSRCETFGPTLNMPRPFFPYKPGSHHYSSSDPVLSSPHHRWCVYRSLVIRAIIISVAWLPFPDHHNPSVSSIHLHRHLPRYLATYWALQKMGLALRNIVAGEWLVSSAVKKHSVGSGVPGGLGFLVHLKRQVLEEWLGEQRCFEQVAYRRWYSTDYEEC